MRRARPVLVFAVLLVAGCGQQNAINADEMLRAAEAVQDNAAAIRQRHFPGGANEDTFYAFERLSDWARHAHHLAVFDVVGEERLGRWTKRVTVRVVRDVLHHRGAPRLPGRFAMTTLAGAVWDLPPLAVGKRYVAPLHRYPPRDWGPLGFSTQLRVEGDRVVALDETVDELAREVRLAAR